MSITIIKETIEDFLRQLSVDIQSFEVAELENGDMVKFSIRSTDSHVLIGSEGKNLMALNHIIKKMVERKHASGDENRINFIVDVNDYQENKISDLKTRARVMAERARFFKSDVEMPPMNPYERMVVHSYFATAPDISTESVGRGKDRRVVLKYVHVEQ